jgi:hypothetical protein
MRYSPYDSEYSAVPSMNDGQLLDYFLFRIVETEEVWGLEDGKGFFIYTVDGHDILPLWPYELYAREAAIARWTEITPASMSLEYFIRELAENLIARDVMVEILPRTDGASGCLVTPHRLLDILEGILDAGEYTLDG